MSIFIEEQWRHREPTAEGDYRWLLAGESGVYETYTHDRGELFKSLQKSWGRCTGHVYHDDHGAIGWVFEKTEHFEDTGEPFLQETWVTLHTAEPTRTVEYHYMGLE